MTELHAAKINGETVETISLVTGEKKTRTTAEALLLVATDYVALQAKFDTAIKTLELFAETSESPARCGCEFEARLSNVEVIAKRILEKIGRVK